jgi:hypothetical protein
MNILLAPLVAILVLVSGATYAATSTPIETSAFNDLAITNKIGFQMSEGISLAEATVLVIEKMAETLKAGLNPEMITSLYIAIVNAGVNNGIEVTSTAFKLAISATSNLLVNKFDVSEDIIVEAGLAAELELALIIDSLPATAAGPQITQTPTAINTSIITSNSAISGGGAGTPAI